MEVVHEMTQCSEHEIDGLSEDVSSPDDSDDSTGDEHEDDALSRMWSGDRRLGLCHLQNAFGQVPSL